MKVALDIVKGPMKGRRFEFSGHETFLFGRSPDAHCSLPDDKFVSRHHFLIDLDPPAMVIRDLQSSNGTYLNGRKFGGPLNGADGTEDMAPAYWERSLADGDEIAVGDTVFKLSVHSDQRCGLCGNLIPFDKEAKCAAIDVDTHKELFICESCSKAQLAAAKAPPAQRDFDRDRSAADLLVNLLKNLGGAGPRKLPAFPNYQIVRRLGGGGMGDVFLAQDRDGSPCVIKVMKADEEVTEDLIRRFREREIPISLGMDHPNVLKYLAGDYVDGVFYLVMELAEEGSLQDLMEKRGRVDPATACGLVAGSLEGLEYIHGKGVIHRDLKPQNILLVRSAQGLVPKICDFGLSKDKSLSKSLTSAGMTAGSVPFMAPDQILDFKNVSPAADVFSMGATLYNMISGQFVNDFSPKDDPILVKMDARRLVPIARRLPALHAALARVIDKSIAFYPKDRYASAGAFRAELLSAMPA